MNYSKLLKLKERYQNNKSSISTDALKNFDKDFELLFTHNSTAIEGNTLTLIETKLILDDKISVGGKSLREIYEVVNHHKAFQYVKNCIEAGKALDEKTVKDIHSILMENILVGGVYRNVDVYISGSEHNPPSPNEMYSQIKNFYSDLPFQAFKNPIELAAWTHAEFVKIHPFVDGNGRTSRLIMNYQLMSNGFLPVSIKKENRLDYYNTLEQYAVNNNLEPFAEMVAELEEKQLEKYNALIIQPTNEANDELEL